MYTCVCGCVCLAAAVLVGLGFVGVQVNITARYWKIYRQVRASLRPSFCTILLDSKQVREWDNSPSVLSEAVLCLYHYLYNVLA